MASIHNINDIVEVTLTKYGKEILEKHYTDLGIKYNVKKNKYQTELWHLMHVFGKYLYMGNSKIPFKNNVITI